MRLRLSQSQLTVLECCPRKFQHIYLDQLVLPISPEARSHLDWGSQFHLLMQQQALGLPLYSSAGQRHPVQDCVSQFIAAVPDLFTPQDGRVQESEHRRTLEMQDYLLTVVYDLLMLDADHAEILDWKTYAKPQTTRWLESSWQTRLYLFVLAETSAYAPEHLSMTYWFVPPPGKAQPSNPSPPHVTIRYSQSKHQETRRDLTRLLTQLTQWLEAYQSGEPFPQVPDGQPCCGECAFAVRCQRTPVDPVGDRPDIPTIQEIEEVML